MLTKTPSSNKINRLNQLSKPSWIKIKPPTTERYHKLKKELNLNGLNTVCQEAKCPNLNECWSTGTATIMILGDTCTRACRFCNVKTGNPKGMIDKQEPLRVAKQLAQSNLDYVVITCVDRDDLADGGAGIFAQTIIEIKKQIPNLKVECLISDYRGSFVAIETIVKSDPHVVAHNLETTERLTKKVRDPKSNYHQSLQLLRRVKELNPTKLTKSSLMVGLGESLLEIEEACDDLKKNGVDIVTFGQYLRPNRRLLPVEKYYTPVEFKYLEKMARKKGFLFVASGSLVRSSYRASELFVVRKLIEN